jgi:hypothetical protein
MYITVDSAAFAYCSHMYILCILDIHTHTHTKTFDTRRNHSPTEDAATCLRVQGTVNKKEVGEMDAKRQTVRCGLT